MAGEPSPKHKLPTCVILSKAKVLSAALVCHPEQSVWVTILMTEREFLHRSAMGNQRLRAERDALGRCASDAQSAPGLS